MFDSVFQRIIEVMERGWVPDRLTRWMIRRLCRRRLMELRSGNPSTDNQVRDFADQMRVGPIAPVPEKANEQHYELPAEFFELMLGRHLKYSCCFFETSQSSLDDAERRSLQLTCQRAEIVDGQDVLELGCGWGSLTLWMLQQYPHLRVTAVSNSETQRQWIIGRAAAAHLENRLTVITADMNEFAIDQRFDRVVSCEMFEHMRNYEHLLRRIAGWLRPGGKLFVHLFCHKQFAYEFQTTGVANWMGRYFFTGGIMPSFELLHQFPTHLRVARSWAWPGVHYQRTCNAWLRRLDAHRKSAREILAGVYGEPASGRWLQRWRMFLMAGAELFGFESGQQWLIGHYLMEPVQEIPQPEPTAIGDTAASECDRTFTTSSVAEST